MNTSAPGAGRSVGESLKKIIGLLLLVLVVFLALNRYRVYLRDPLATMTRNGVKEDGAQVYINYRNDIYVENDHAPMYIEVLQHGGNAGVPPSPSCLHWTACLLDADPAAVIAGSPTRLTSMEGTVVRFTDDRGPAVVTLR